MPSLCNLLQIEFARNNGYRPDPKLFPNAIDLTPASVLAIDPNISDHATQVAQILTSGPAAGLIGKHYFLEAVTWMLGRTGPAVLAAGRTFAPSPLGVDLVNCSFGALVLTADLFQKAKLQIERDNAVLIVAPPDAGDPSGYTFPGAVVSPNCLRVVSSTTGSVIVSSDIPMVSEPVSWNSFAEPTSAQVVAAMISWCKDQFNGTFKAADIVATILASSVKLVGFAYPQINYNAAMTGLHALYGIPVAVVVTPTPSPVAPSPPVTPVPTIDEECADIAKTCEVTYDPAAKTFSGVNSAQVKQLAQALQAAGL